MPEGGAARTNEAPRRPPWESQRFVALLDLDEISLETDLANLDELADEGSETISERSLRELVSSYARLRAGIAGSRRERGGAPAARPGTYTHMRLLDLEWALERLPEEEFAVLDLVGLGDLQRDEAARRLGVSIRTVDARLARAFSSLDTLLTGPREGPPLRTLRVALDPDPLQVLAECVRRHRAVFDKLIEEAQRNPKLGELRVRWLPGKNTCVPVLSGKSFDELTLPLLSLVTRSEN